MADPSARRRLYFDGCGDGFGPLYNAAKPPKQAGYVPGRGVPGFASGGSGAYLGGWQTIGPDLMSAVERLEDRDGETPSSETAAASAIEAQLTQSPAKRSARLRPLLALAPYVARYRGRAFLALIALTVAAITTLLVPVAVRRMIDFG